jgi:predicted nuclease of predicted toxin-antitoxin system
MPIAFYMDEHVDSAIAAGLRRRRVDVLRVQDDGYDNTADTIILDHAMAIDRVMVTQDMDFLVEVVRRQRAGEPFAGVVYFKQHSLPIGQVIADLELMAGVYDPIDMADKVEHLFL